MSTVSTGPEAGSSQAMAAPKPVSPGRLLSKTVPRARSAQKATVDV